MQCLHAALLAFSAPLASLQPHAARGGAISASALNDDWATPLEVATKKSMRQVATYRASMEAEVERLREQVASTSKEMEEAARARSVPLPNDWATPLEMATRRTTRQVETFAASMEAEVASLGSQLQEAQAAHKEEMQVAKDGAKMLLKELADEKKSKDFHFAKAREFYKQWTDAEAELEKLRGAS